MTNRLVAFERWTHLTVGDRDAAFAIRPRFERKNFGRRLLRILHSGNNCVPCCLYKAVKRPLHQYTGTSTHNCERQVMWKICDHLYLGIEAEALDRQALEAARVTHVLNCTREIACPFTSDFTYLHLPFSDPDASLHTHITEACNFIERARRRGTVFVHCKGAISRSPSMIIAYFCHGGSTLHEAAKRLGDIVPTRPNAVFLQQIASHFGEVVSESDIAEIHRLLARKADPA